MSFKPIPPKNPSVTHSKAEKRSGSRLFGVSRVAARSNLLGVAGPAFLLFSGAAVLWQAPLSDPLGAETERVLENSSFTNGDFFEKNWIVPASQTLFVSQQITGKHTTVQGLLESSNQSEVKSPTSGEIAKLLVENGQYVTEGQEVALLTTGVAPPAAGTVDSSPLDQWQQRAEKEQLAAATEQGKLETQAKAANAELTRAQARVVAAQRRVADARQLIARLKEGEEIYKSQVNASSDTKSEMHADPQAKSALLKESQELQKEAEAAEAKAKAAEKAMRAAEALLNASQQKLQVATSKEKYKDKEKTPASEPSASGEETSPQKTSVTEASASATSAKSTLEAGSELAKNVSDARVQSAQARREWSRLQAHATEARKRSNQAAQHLAQGLHLFDDEKKETKEAKPASGEKLTLSEVARTARAAIQESNEAIADAERIQRKLAGHSQRIAQSHQRFEQSAEQLRKAQQRIWENVPAMRTSQTPLMASQSGILTWTAKTLQIVKPDETLAQISRPDRLEVVVEDRSEAWKLLQPDQQLVALVRRKELAPPQKAAAANVSLRQASASSTSAGFRPITAELASNSSGIGAPSSARILAIAPPNNSGAPARIRIAVHNPPKEKENNSNGRAPRAFAPGMMAFFSLAQEPEQTSIRIPTAAVRRGEGGRTYVAVLLPLEKQGHAPSVDLCHVEWREVFLAPGDGQSNRVKTGLKEGERLVLRPNEIYQFTLTYGEKATVGVEQI